MSVGRFPARRDAAGLWSNAILGRTDVVDASYGNVYSVPNDYDQYWRDNSGYLHGGTWGAQPDPSWHMLDPINL